MATSGPTNLPVFFSGDADFRTWVQGIHNALASFADLTQTADTGQINPATVTRPGTINTTGGYEIWRFNDALQATVPVFFRLEYGTGGALDRPGMWVTVGGSSNGTGTIGGAGAKVQVAAAASKLAGNTGPFAASCEPGRIDLGVGLDAASANFGMIVHIERSRDATGAATADGWVFAAGSAGGTVYTYSPLMGVLAASSNAKLLRGFAATYTPGWSAVGADVAVEGIVGYFGKPVYGLGLAAYANVDIPALTTFTATICGAARTFLACGLTGAGLTVLAVGSLAIRWE
jgi:hypothetical protein